MDLLSHLSTILLMFALQTKNCSTNSYNALKQINFKIITTFSPSFDIENSITISCSTMFLQSHRLDPIGNWRGYPVVPGSPNPFLEGQYPVYFSSFPSSTHWNQTMAR